jgi:hypothetical protein
MMPFLSTQSWDQAVRPFRDGARERRDWAHDFLARMKNIDGAGLIRKADAAKSVPNSEA